MTLQSYHTENVIEVGVDEAGRGPLIGRVYAGAVIWPVGLTSPLIKDSKKYKNAAEREKAYEFVIENAIAYGISYIEPEEIDQINILQSSIKAMHQAIRETYINPQHIIADGNKFKLFNDQNDNAVSFTTVIKGDDKYYSIAAASILAKVAHDRYINELCDKYPNLEKYGLRTNMGYGTAEHLAAIANYGVTKFHRLSFASCKNQPHYNI